MLGPQISFDLGLAKSFKGKEFCFDAEMYNRYLSARGLDESQMAASSLVFRPRRPQMTRTYYDPAGYTMSVYANGKDKPEELTAAVFDRTERLIAHHEGGWSRSDRSSLWLPLTGFGVAALVGITATLESSHPVVESELHFLIAAAIVLTAACKVGGLRGVDARMKEARKRAVGRPLVDIVSRAPAQTPANAEAA